MTSTRLHRMIVGTVRSGLWLALLCCLVLNPVRLFAADAPLRVRVGIFENQPIVFRIDDNTYGGIAIDVLESIAQQADWKLDYVYAPWKDQLQALNDGTIDLLLGIAYSEERTKQFRYTQQTLINNWGTVSRPPGSQITSLADLQGLRVAMMTGSTHSNAFKRIMAEFQFPFQAVETDSYQDAMKAVKNDKADAVVSNRLISLLHGIDYHLTETGIIFNPVEVRFASPKSASPFIVQIIDQHLSQQKIDDDSVYNRSLRHWLQTSGKTQMPDWLPMVAGLALMLLFMLTISNWLARRQISTRTAELTESESRFRQLTENIREVFWITSPDWKTVYYISPAFEQLWNQRCEDLYRNPTIWLDAVHPEDKPALVDDLRRRSNGKQGEATMPEFRVLNDSGVRWVLSRAYPITNKRGEITRICGVTEDITERKLANDTIDFMAHHDPLTRLTNRFAFEKKLIALMEHTDWDQHSHALMYIDLDQFKIVNDTCGHAAGDQMLIDLTKLLIVTIGEAGTLARLGGDEFGLILENTTREQAQALADELLQSIQMFRFEWKRQKFSVGASIGLVMVSNNRLSRHELLSAADMACYVAKERGRNRLHVYTEDDVEMMQRHGEMQWVNRIKAALEEDRFVIYRQTIRPMQADCEYRDCCEFLFRMLDEKGDLIMPGTFIPAAERYELMPQLDRWVVRHVIDYLQEMQDSDSPMSPSFIAFVNLSGQVFNDDNFASFLLELLNESQINPQNICLEITETAAIGNLDKAVEFIEQLRALGFNFALDDFGSGMSSFSYLKFLPVDFLKIDGVFIKDLMKDPMNASIVDAITRIGHTAKLKVVAEWVEDNEVLNKLTEIGIDYAQGYAIDKPLPALAGPQAAHRKRH